MDVTPTKFWLSEVEYLEGKRAVTACFSQLNIKRTLRLPFFPFFFISKKAAGMRLLQEVLSSYGARKFRLEEQTNAFKVTASTFSDLNRLANLVFTSINFIPVVLPPERQFLLEKGWSYFDCFDFSEEENPKKLEANELPKASLRFFSEPLHETLAQLVRLDRAQAEKIAESVALSNALSLPFDSLPPHRGLWIETLFENMFHTLGSNRQRKQGGMFSQSTAPRMSAGDFTEIDLSMLWPALLSRPLYNIGFDSIDCDCCRPEGISAPNILPNSKALIEIQREAFYFQSLSHDFSREFHEANQSKESRLRRMHEFGLSAAPVGPFARGQRVVVPLSDAMQLAREKSASLLLLQETHWFCQRNESIVSRQIGALQSKVAALEKRAEEIETGSIRLNGVLGSQAVSLDPEYLFQRGMLDVYSSLLSMVVPHLANAKSAFFSKEVAESVKATQSSVLNAFRQIAEQNSGRIISTNYGALVRTEKPLSLIKEFSSALNLASGPRAKIALKKRQ